MYIDRSSHKERRGFFTSTIETEVVLGLHRVLPVKISIQADNHRISNVWATQYTPNTSGAHEVALPDKYVKFANLGWWSDIPNSIEDNYDSPEYTINVYNPSTNIAANSVPVDEVGPWNTAVFVNIVVAFC